MKPQRKNATIVGDINQLPEECISHVISLTAPRDACASSAVSRAFRSAADSDATWQRFLPSDYASFLSQAIDPVEYDSKKELYFRLCDHPLLINGGLMDAGCHKLHVVRNPVLLTLSLEKRLIPCSLVLKLLESKGLPVAKRGLLCFSKQNEKQFLEKVVIPYEHTIPGLHQAYTDIVSGEHLILTC